MTFHLEPFSLFKAVLNSDFEDLDYIWTACYQFRLGVNRDTGELHIPLLSVPFCNG